MIKLALIGTGRWGKNIQRTLENISNVKLVAVADSAKEARQVAKIKNLDGVVIATPGSTHASVALPFIRQGLPTLIEKPLTTSLVEAVRLQRAATKSGAIVFVGHIHLYNPAFRKAKLLLAGRQLHTIYFAGVNHGPVRPDTSVLWDWGPHGISLVHDILRQQPRATQAWGNRDTILMRLIYPRGPLVTLHHSWIAPSKEVRLVIVADGRSIVVDETAVSKITAYDRKARVSHPRYSQTPPLTLELRAFLDTIRLHRRSPLTDLASGVAVVRVLAAAERSLKLDGRMVKI